MDEAWRRVTGRSGGLHEIGRLGAGQTARTRLSSSTAWLLRPDRWSPTAHVQPLEGTVAATRNRRSTSLSPRMQTLQPAIRALFPLPVPTRRA